ncbi:MAG TPA: hypothetical protein VKN99_03465 [Polyangia bacterium]|nr:hypothetical protein [Polyangia bacterium]
MPAPAVFTGPSGYRDAHEGLRARRDALLAERRGQAAAVPASLKDLYARRAARYAAGFMGLAGALALVVAILAQMHGLTGILLAAQLLMLPAYWVGYAEGKARARLLVDGFARPTEDVCADIVRLGSITPAADLAARADRLERRSVAAPLMALAFLTPLTLHYLFALLFLDHDTQHFDQWITLSAAVVGHSHGVLALAAWLYARKLRQDQSATLPTGGMAALGWTFLSSLVTALFWPPLLIAAGLVAVTGFAFIPLSFSWIRYRVGRERTLLTQ